MPGPQRGPQRQSSESTGLDPQMQAMVSKYGIDALRSMAKTAMAGGTPSLPTSAPMNMPGLPAGRAGGKNVGQGVRMGGTGGRQGSGFVNPHVVNPAASARANEEKMRQQLLERMALMKLAAEGPKAEAAQVPPVAAPDQPAMTPTNAEPVQAPVQQPAPIPQTFAQPAAQAAPQPISGLRLLASAVAIAVVVGGGALVAAKMSEDKNAGHRRAGF